MEGDDVDHNFHRSGRFHDLLRPLQCSMFLAVCAWTRFIQVSSVIVLTKQNGTRGLGSRPCAQYRFNTIKTQETAAKLLCPASEDAGRRCSRGRRSPERDAVEELLPLGQRGEADLKLQGRAGRHCQYKHSQHALDHTHQVGLHAPK